MTVLQDGGTENSGRYQLVHTVSTTLQKNSVMSALGNWVLWGNSSGLALVVILPQLEGCPLAGEVNRTRGTHTCGCCERLYGDCRRH